MREARAHFVESDEILVSGEGYIPLESGDIWRRRRTRGTARQMHAWFFYYLLRPFGDSTDSSVAQKLMRLLTAWREIVGLPPTRIPMAYHDEATAQRAIALTCFIQDYSHLLSNEDTAFLDQILCETADMLADDEFHSWGTNHGMYQDLALVLISARVPEGDKFLELAIERLNDYFINAFTLDGIHKEQSPQYHSIVSNHLCQYTNFLSSHNATMAHELQGVFERTESYAIMAISPLGKFAPISDTSNELVISSGYSHVYKSAEYQYAVTQGLLGNTPRLNSLIAADTGVAIFREDWEDPSSVYIYFSAAYNSDYHKHSDELSVYLVHRGIEILREAGPNGYEMQDPYTEYGFSSFAHNTLIVNNEGLPRTAPEDMDKVGLTGVTGTGDGDTAPDSTVAFTVDGWNNRFSGVEHRRRVAFWGSDNEKRPKVLQIIDTITSRDRNDYQLLWHLGPDVSAEAQDDIVRIRDSEGANLAELTVTSDTRIDFQVISGQSDPKIQGWYFPSMGVSEPAQTLILSFTDDSAEIKSKITLL